VRLAAIRWPADVPPIDLLFGLPGVDARIDPSYRKAFEQYSRAENFGSARVAIWLSAIAATLLVVMTPAPVHPFPLLVCTWLPALLLSLFHNWARYNYPYVFSASLSGALGWIVSERILGTAPIGTVYPSLLLTYLYATTLLRLPFRFAFTLCLVSFPIVVIACLRRYGTEASIPALVWVAIIIYLGLRVARHIEASARKVFRDNMLLDEANAQLKESNEALASKSARLESALEQVFNDNQLLLEKEEELDAANARWRLSAATNAHLSAQLQSALDEVKRDNATLKERTQALDRANERLRSKSAALDAALKKAEAARAEAEAARRETVETEHAAHLLLEARAEAALKSEQAKVAFMAHTAHDLRNAHLGLDALIKACADQHAAGRDDIADTLRSVALGARQIRTMLTNIMDISNHESGAYVPRMATFDLAQLLWEVHQLEAARARERGLEIMLKIVPQGACPAYTDRAILCRCLANLISNAVKFTPAKDKRWNVMVGLVRLGGRYRIDVRDTGIGIPRDDFERIWEPYVQLKTPYDDLGCGLGLSMVRAARAKLGYDVHFSSRVDKGSRFSIELPVPTSIAPLAADATAQTPGPAATGGSPAC
jgi:signal transduction histidine kinase